jgi:hypothetical protein
MLMANNDGVQKNAVDDRLPKLLLGRGMVVSGCESVGSRQSAIYGVSAVVQDAVLGLDSQCYLGSSVSHL